MRTRVDWRHRGDYIRSRSKRRPGDVDIDPAWANEAVSDTEAIWLDPDPKSKSGQSVRVIGYSPAAALVLTVILVADVSGQAWWGVNAWRANGTDEGIYRKGQT